MRDLTKARNQMMMEVINLKLDTAIEKMQKLNKDLTDIKHQRQQNK